MSDLQKVATVYIHGPGDKASMAEIRRIYRGLVAATANHHPFITNTFGRVYMRAYGVWETEDSSDHIFCGNGIVVTSFAQKTFLARVDGGWEKIKPLYNREVGNCNFVAQSWLEIGLEVRR